MTKWAERNGLVPIAAIRASVVAMLELGVNQLIGLLWQHPRPFAIGLGHTFMPHASDSSFPSDHATVFSAIALVLLMGGMRWLGCTIVAFASIEENLQVLRSRK